MFYSIFMSVVSFVLLIFSIVFVHELGHFLFARLNGVRVDVFSIGFGKELFGWNDKKGTRWKVCLIPLGGYVKMFGQADLPESEKEAKKLKKSLSEEDKKVHYDYKNRLQRISIVLAGPLFNFIFAFLIMFGLTFFIGKDVYESRYVKSVAENAPAFVYLEEGDMIQSIDGVDVLSYEDIKEIILSSEGKELSLKLERDGKKILRRITPERVDENSPYLLGYVPDFKVIDTEEFGFVSAVVEAGNDIYDLTNEMVSGIARLLSGQESAKNVGGVISIGGIAKQSLEAGFVTFISIVALISINLGLVNLLPLPILDGGHILILTVESFIRRDLPVKLKLAMMNVGAILLMSLLLLSVFNDVLRIVGV